MSLKVSEKICRHLLIRDLMKPFHCASFNVINFHSTSLFNFSHDAHTIITMRADTGDDEEENNEESKSMALYNQNTKRMGISHLLFPTYLWIAYKEQ